MTIARIADNEVAEQRSDITLDDVPAHKRGQWRPVVGDPPAYDATTHYLTGPVYVIGEAEVTRQWTVNERPRTAAMVNAERDRRMAVFSFGGKEYDFDADSRQNVAGAGTLALAAIINGAQPGDLRWSDPDADFVWLARDNTATAMDAQTTWAFAQAAAAWKRDLIYAARAIKDMQGGIPLDYASNESYWP